MSKIVFIDTSVLLNILDVPGNANAENHARDVQQFEDLVTNGAQLVLPLTTFVETGNAIAKVAGGGRHRCIRMFIAFLEATLDEQAPWVSAGFGNSNKFLRRVVYGAPTSLDDLMRQGIGAGDAAILAEIQELRARLPSATPVEIWTHDRALSAHT